jgi:hypothetical protein
VDLLRGGLKVSDQVGSLVGFLQTGKHHLCSGDVLLWVFEVFEESTKRRRSGWRNIDGESRENSRIFSPCDALGFVGVGVGESWSLASLATEESAQVGSDLVLTSSFDGMALNRKRNRIRFVDHSLSSGLT